MYQTSLKQTFELKRVIVTFVLVYLGLLLPFMAAIQYEEHLERARYHERLQSEYATTLEVFSTKLERRFLNMSTTALLLADSRLLFEYIRQPDESLAILIDTWKRLMDGHGEIRQLRFIDPEGYEQVRVEYTPESGAYAVSDLQYKGNRDYFKYAKSMTQRWAFYGADLEMDHGKYVIPHQIAMRVIVPVADFSGGRLGYLVMNLAVSRMFENINKVLRLEDSPVIVGKEGHYLFGVDDVLLFGSRLDERAEHSLSIDNPSMWREVRSNKEGVYEQDGVTTIYRSISFPLPGLGVALMTALHDYSMSHVDKIVASEVEDIYSEMMIELLVLLVIAVPITIFIHHRRAYINNTRLSYAAMRSMAPIMVTDKYGIVQQVNDAFCVAKNKQKDDVIGLAPTFLKSSEHNQEFYDEAWAHLIKEGTWKGELHSRSKEGELIVEQVAVSAVTNSSGAVTNYVVSFVDLTEEKRLTRELQKLSVTDTLTGCKNRRYFDAAMDRQVETFSRHSDQVFCLALIDIDHFKKVNDTHGHDVGDQVLQNFARILNKSVRAVDLVCRVGGEEFAVVMPNTKVQEAEVVLERIRHSVEQDANEPRITCSIGFTESKEDSNPDALYRSADTGLYIAKREGRNQV